MTFKSILFDQEEVRIEDLNPPEYFLDLLLDSVVDAITKSKKDYNLKPYFYLPIEDISLIKFRTEVFKELENQEILNLIQNFSNDFITVRQGLNLVQQIEFPYNKMGWYLDTILAYCKSLIKLNNSLEENILNSKGLTQFSEYLDHYVNSERFKLLFSEAKRVKADLVTVRYSINLQSGSFTVQKYNDEKNYGIEVLRLFEKFRQNKDKILESNRSIKNGMNHVESIILDFVAKIFPEPFTALKSFCNQFPTFIDEKILLFNREIQFYIAYLQFITKIKGKGLEFCFPEITTSKQEIYAFGGFDIALALKLLNRDDFIIRNDFFLTDPERIIVVTGPNQGGKTTFARMFGQLHYLTRLGMTIPGTKAKLFVSDNIFTCFEREETITNLQGKLLEELSQIKNIYSQLTSKSIVVINEIFNSTTLDDAIFLGKEIMTKLVEIGVFCVVVTFIDEISKLGPSVISMVSNVDSDNSEIRTFKIQRKPADGLAYALAIAKKHQLSFSQIKERVEF